MSEFSLAMFSQINLDALLRFRVPSRVLFSEKMTGLWQVTTDFEEQWADGKVQEWECEGKENGHISAQPAVIDLDYYRTVEELLEVGPERLKEVTLTTLACIRIYGDLYRVGLDLSLFHCNVVL